MNTPPSPSEGQIRCQGGFGHHWEPTFRPHGYETLWWITVFARCTSCGTLRISHMDSNGRPQPHVYKYPPDWVKYASGEAPDYEARRLAAIAALDPITYAVNPKIKRKLPRTRNGSR